MRRPIPPPARTLQGAPGACYDASSRRAVSMQVHKVRINLKAMACNANVPCQSSEAGTVQLRCDWPSITVGTPRKRLALNHQTAKMLLNCRFSSGSLRLALNHQTVKILRGQIEAPGLLRLALNHQTARMGHHFSRLAHLLRLALNHQTAR